MLPRIPASEEEGALCSAAGSRVYKAPESLCKSSEVSSGTDESFILMVVLQRTDGSEGTRGAFPLLLFVSALKGISRTFF